MFNEFSKKEAPIQGLAGMGGGVTRFGGAGATEYWIAESRDGSVNAYGQYVSVNSNGDISVSAAPDPGNYVTEMYDKDGAQYWSKEMTSKAYGYGDTKIDSSGNIYHFGQRGFIKYNSSGTLQLNKNFYYSQFSGQIPRINEAVDIGSGNFILGGEAETSSGGLYKMNSSGTLSIARRIQKFTTEGIKSLDVDSSGNIYALGQMADDDIGIVKFDNTGATTWVRKFGNSGATSYNFRPRSLQVDSSGNVYAFAYGSNLPQKKVFVKFNTSGTLQWQKDWVDDTFSPERLHIDANDNIYSTGTQNSKINLTKWNSDGSVNFSRNIDRSNSSSDSGFGITTDSDGKIILTGRVKPGGGRDTLFLAKLPNDGSLNGTYGDYTIATYSFPTISNTSYYLNSSYTIDNLDKLSYFSTQNDSGTVANSGWTYSFQALG